MIDTIVYLHGFLSSPNAYKARVLQQAAQAKGIAFYAPDLTLPPNQVAALLSEWAAERDMRRVAVVGASLGGFYAAWLAAQTGARSVLLNPATQPWTILAKYVGPQRLYDSDRVFDVKAEFGTALQHLNRSIPVSDDNRLVIVTTGDTVVDYRQTLERFADSRCHTVQGSDHAISDFADMVDDVMEYVINGQYAPLQCES